MYYMTKAKSAVKGWPECLVGKRRVKTFLPSLLEKKTKGKSGLYPICADLERVGRVGVGRKEGWFPLSHFHNFPFLP